jgi:predicted nucleic acid-binding protein
MSPAIRPILYVETNFLVEIFREQEQAPSCRELLKLAEQGRIEIVLPEACVHEAALKRRLLQSSRQSLHEQMQLHVAEMGRSVSRDQALKQAVVYAAKAIMSQSELDETSLRHCTTSLLAVATLLPLTPAAHTLALTLRPMQDFDACILECISLHAKQHNEGWKRLCTRDADFKDDVARSVLQDSGCALINSYPNAIEAIRALSTPD